MSMFFVSALAIVASAGAATAATVEFRIVERTGQSVVTGSDALLELAVQAKVTGGALGAFSFDIALPGEAESNGTLERARINTAAHAYFAGTPWTAGSTIGQHGMAYPYTFLASQGTQAAAFNGVINTNAGTFTNNSSEHEIGLITGRVMGPQLLGTPGIDADLSGAPDTYSGSGSTASLDPAIAATYFASGQFVDIYRFRYTVTNFTPRNLDFTLRNVLAENFSQFTTNGIFWGAQDVGFAGGDIHGTPLSATVAALRFAIPSPAASALLGMGALVALRRRRAA